MNESFKRLEIMLGEKIMVTALSRLITPAAQDCLVAGTMTKLCFIAFAQTPSLFGIPLAGFARPADSSDAELLLTIPLKSIINYTEPRPGFLEKLTGGTVRPWLVSYTNIHEGNEELSFTVENNSAEFSVYLKAHIDRA